MRARGLSAAVALALLALPAGCGSSSADEQKVRNVVNGLYDSLSARDAHKFCDTLSEKQRKVVASGAGRGRKRSCEQVMGYVFTFSGAALKTAKDAKVKDISVSGDKAAATVEFKGRKGSKGSVALAKEHGEWKVSNFNLKKL